MVRYVLIVLIIVSVCGSCSDITNVSPHDTASFSSADYLWKASSTTFTLGEGSGISNWTIRDSGGLRILTEGGSRVVLSSDASETRVTGLQQGDFLDLDSGSYFSSIESVRTSINTPRCATAIESGSLYVGADSGVFIRDPGAMVFRFAGLAGSVTSIAQNTQAKLIYAGIRDGSIWSGSDKGWTRMATTGLPAGSIQALGFAPDQALYAAVAGATGLYHYADGSGWTLVPFMQSKSVQIVHPFSTPSPKYQKALVIATSGGEIGVLNLEGSPNLDPRKVATRIVGFSNGDGGALLAGTDAGILSGDVHTNTWSPLSSTITSSVAAIHTWYPASGAASVFFASSGSVFTTSLTGAGTSVVTSLPLGDVIQLGHFDQKLYALTSRGCYDYHTQWQEVAGLARQTYYRDEGPLVLLRNPFTVGASWRAATLVTADHQVYPITARVIAHYDTLRVGEQSFVDVVMLRYANEHADLSAESVAVPYWVLYFGKGNGLVMAEKVRGDSVVQRQTLLP